MSTRYIYQHISSHINIHQIVCVSTYINISLWYIHQHISRTVSRTEGWATCGIGIVLQEAEEWSDGCCFVGYVGFRVQGLGFSVNHSAQGLAVRLGFGDFVHLWGLRSSLRVYCLGFHFTFRVVEYFVRSSFLSGGLGCRGFGKFRVLLGSLGVQGLDR